MYMHRLLDGIAGALVGGQPALERTAWPWLAPGWLQATVRPALHTGMARSNSSLYNTQL